MDPRSTPDTISAAPVAPPVTGEVKLTNRNANPPGLPAGSESDCIVCTGTQPAVVVDKTPPPTPIVVKPPIQHVPSTVLLSKVISLPQPPYPQIARTIRAQGPVNVQILVDEQGKVISAQATSGNVALTTAAREAALRARFTPTVLNGTPVKVQGTIIYNFVLQ